MTPTMPAAIRMSPTMFQFTNVPAIWGRGSTANRKIAPAAPRTSDIPSVMPVTSFLRRCVSDWFARCYRVIATAACVDANDHDRYQPPHFVDKKGHLRRSGSREPAAHDEHGQSDDGQDYEDLDQHDVSLESVAISEVTPARPMMPPLPSGRSCRLLCARGDGFARTRRATQLHCGHRPIGRHRCCPLVNRRMPHPCKTSAPPACRSIPTIPRSYATYRPRGWSQKTAPKV
jgi:hypothetical protein